MQAALADYQAGRKTQALEKLRGILRRDPSHTGAYYLGGMIRYELGDFEKAQTNFEKATSDPEKGYNAHYYLGRIHQRQNRKAEALKAYETYASLTASSNGKAQAQKQIDLLRRELGAIADPSDKEKSVSDKSVTAHTNQAKSPQPKSAPLSSTGDKTATSQEAKSAPAPDTATRGSVVAALVAEALDESLLYLIPDSAGISGRKLREAHAFMRRERFEKATQTLQQVVAAYGGSENAEVAGLNLAALYVKLGLGEEARARLQTFAEGAPERTLRYMGLANYLMGRAYLLSKDAESAVKAEQYLLKVKAQESFAPTQAELSWQLAMTGLRLSDPNKRALYLEKAVTHNTSPVRLAELKLRLGQHNIRDGRLPKAEEWLQGVAEHCSNPGSAPFCEEAALRLADLAFRRGDAKGALSRYQAFLKAYPQSGDAAWAQYQIGNAYKSVQRFSDALNAYQRVLDNWPDSYWSAQAKWQREDTQWQREYAEVLD